ncbi:MAG: selenocysteine-specific translation elongation factor [Bryobacteraceae bacterium]
MKHIIVGTAGHIDHGKTALVKALTGIDADRLAEEKRRGITIDLGFAHLQLTADLRLGFVDVPGHERFVKNMLAGVGGIDLVMLVVAADESVKPQTREHFDICRLLEIPRGIVVLTKSDLVDEDLLGLARLEVTELVAGSFLEGAPVLAVSSTTGQGLDHLRRELTHAAAAVPEKNSAGYFRLPIDRVFSVKGFGTVVTGTLISGAVEKEQETEVYPSGRILRVRGVEVHGLRTGRAVAGQRTALNLADIEAAGLTRGDVLSEPGRFHAVRHIECRLEMLPSAKPLKHRAPVHFHAGTAEIEAEVRLFGAATLRPGETAYARLILRQPALLLPGDRFIIRMFSPVATIGGGVVVDTGERRYTRGFAVPHRLAVLAGPDQGARIALLVREAAFGMGMPDLVARTGMAASAIAQAAARAGVLMLPLTPPWFIDRAWFQAARNRMEETVREFHRQRPLLPGMARPELRASLAKDLAPFLLDALLASSGEVVAEGEIVRRRGHAMVLREDEEHARQTIELAFERAGLAVPAVAEVLAQAGVEAARARTLLEILIHEKRLVRINQELVFHHSAMEKLRNLLAKRRSVRFTVPTFKEWTGISRKYAIPLLEYLDRVRVTRREGDERLIL